MGLLAPWFLAGLGLLGLPLYLHLLKRHKSTPQHFSSLMFFERSTSASVRQRQLDYLLLLALRLALLALIVFAFTRPFVTSTAAGPGGDRLLLFAIDESASMAFGDRLPRAKQDARAVLSQVRGNTRAQVIAFSSSARLLNEPTADPAILQAALDSIAPTGARSSLGDLAGALRNLARASAAPVEVHLFSDLQRSSMPPGFAELRLEPGTQLVLHRSADKDEPNWTVESVSAPGRLVDPKSARVEATLAGHNTPESTRFVELRVNGRTVARQSAVIPASGRAVVAFTGLDAPFGFSRCEVAFAEPDSLPADDRSFFSVQRADPERILFLHGPRSAASAVFVRAALETAAPGLFTLDVLPAASAASLNLDKYAAAVLSDPGPLPASLDTALQRHVEQGRGLLLAVGPATTAAGKAPVAGLSIRGSQYEARAADRFSSLGEADLAHPAIARTDRWDGVRFFQLFDLEPGSATVVARATTGAPLLLEWRKGAGRALLLASTLDNDANDFPLHPAFVPFIDQSLRWLSGLEERAARLTVGAALDLKSDASSAASVEVLDPDGDRALSLADSARQSTLALDRPGFWEVRRPGGRQELVAVNIDRRESDLTLMPLDSAELWQGAPLDRATPAPSATAAAEPRRRQLWPWILAFALLAGLGEAFVASQHFSREAL
ncbi:MAG TPA: VWA domain-containing protein [Bryobacteraceae bacterium]|nr:polysaccharide deacetylase [Bryobacterales bacterium]HRJ18078.1 VWA domain-containing protein [Bryobacteraceae bacterium]